MNTGTNSSRGGGGGGEGNDDPRKIDFLNDGRAAAEKDVEVSPKARWKVFQIAEPVKANSG